MATKNAKIHVKIEEDIRISIHRQIDLFLQDEKQSEYDFPTNLTNLHRAYIHEYVKNKRLKSKSHGKGEERYLTIYKTSLSAITHDDARLDLTDQSIDMIMELQNAYGAQANRAKGIPKGKRSAFRSCNVYLASAPPSVPPRVHPVATVFDERMRLPIAQFKDIILKCTQQNQVIIISGNTGSGKTTQVPQFVMDVASQNGTPCRIICTQPRRISAVTVAERVCFERNEPLGDRVGYQIRLESRSKPSTNLVFCTNGVLLRCLTGKGVSKFLNNVTQIIIDEVHERDQYSDFLLIALKDNLPKHPQLKVILMSATIESNTFSQYFNNCPVIEIPGRLFPIESFYLEDILFTMDTYNRTVKDVKTKIMSNIEHLQSLGGARGHHSSTANMDDESILLMNDILEVCWIENNPDAFHHFFALVQEENIPVDFQHTETKMTALMIAAAKGYIEIVQNLLDIGANPCVQEKHNYTAYDWACFIHGNSVCSQLLANAMKHAESKQSQPISLTPHAAKQLLDAYHTSFGDERIDHNLIIDVIQFICTTQPDGGILVFLPGFEDIQDIYELLNTRLAPYQRLKVFMLHSKMQTTDQHAVFRPAPQGARKIVLATNIAETSITMDDVAYVIDSGKVKQKYYDSVTATNSLTATWISQACATQRAGRAGRTKPGTCFRLYSRARLEAMDQFTLPEIMRVPLTEICLNTALLTNGASIHDFLNRALQPPAATSVKQSVKYLQKVGALDDEENLTDLGLILAELPVDARLGKMLLYGILLKCYEPVLLIVSLLSVNDLFVIPSYASDKEKVRKARRELAEDSFSDCFCLLRAYQRWYEARSVAKRKDICSRFFLSHSKLTMVYDLRCKLHSHLCSMGLIKSYGPGNIEDVNQFAGNWCFVKACLLVGLYPNVCHLEKYSKAMKTRFEKKIFVHPSSVLADKSLAKKPNDKDATLWLPTEWIAFEEKYKSGRGSMIRCNTVLTPLTIAIFAGPLYFDESESLVECEQSESVGRCKIAIDDWINFIVDTHVAQAALCTRRCVSDLFLKFIQNPRTFQLNTMEYKFLQTLGKLLAVEDSAVHLTNRVDITGNRRIFNKSHDQRRAGGRDDGKRVVSAGAHHQQ